MAHPHTCMSAICHQAPREGWPHGTSTCRAGETVNHLCSSVASSHQAPGSDTATHNIHGQPPLCQGSNGSQRPACGRADGGGKLLGRCTAVLHHSCSQVQGPVGRQQASARPGRQVLSGCLRAPWEPKGYGATGPSSMWVSGMMAGMGHTKFSL